MPSTLASLGVEFPLRSALLGALAKHSPAVVTVADLQAYDGQRLMSVPPDADSEKDLLTALQAIDNSITPDAAGRTALGQLLIAAKASSNAGTTTAATAAAAKLLADKLYSALGTKMNSRIDPIDRIEDIIVKTAHDDLDRGTLSKRCYTLSSMLSLLSTEEEKTVTFGGLPVRTTEAASVSLARNGEVLVQIHRCLRMLLAAGYRETSADSSTPLAGSVGSHGTYTVKDASAQGGKRSARTHFHPEAADAHMLAAMWASSVLSPSQMVAAHAGVFRAAVKELTNKNMNLASALLAVYKETSFVKSATDLSLTVVGAPPPVVASTAADASESSIDVQALARQVKDQANTIKQLREKRPGTPSAFATPAKKGSAASRSCWPFQETGTCPHGAACKFGPEAHKCVRCGGAHGLVQCTEPPP